MTTTAITTKPPLRRHVARGVALVAVVVAAAVAGLQFPLAVLIAAAIFVPLERLRPLNAGQPQLRRDLVIDLTHLVVSIPVAALGALTPVWFFDRTGWFADGIVPAIADRPWLAIALGFLGAELLAYWSHRMLHEISFLWKFHQVHHSIEQMDWIAGVRIHPVGVMLSAAARGAPLALLGVDAGLTALFGVVSALGNAFVHANLNLPLRRIEKWFVTPQLHHWHHATDADAIDMNYGAILSVYDRIFGTYFMPEGREPKSLGIDGVETPDSWWGQFSMPFRS